jgi:hypothetical protein
VYHIPMMLQARLVCLSIHTSSYVSVNGVYSRIIMSMFNLIMSICRFICWLLIELKSLVKIQRESTLSMWIVTMSCYCNLLLNQTINQSGLTCRINSSSLHVLKVNRFDIDIFISDVNHTSSFVLQSIE